MRPSFRLVLLASGLLKAGLALAFAELPPRLDEIEFLRLGRALYEGTPEAGSWRAPAYPWMVALGLLLAGGRPVGVRLLQVLLSLGSSWLVYRIGCREWTERAGFWAATFVAFYPSHVAFSHLLWSETLYTFFLLLALERLLVVLRSPHARGAAVAAGGCLGAAALTRSTGLVLLLATAILLLATRRRAGGVAVAAWMLGAAALVVLPWSATATARAGRLTWIDTNAGFNLWSGNNPHIPGDLQGLWSLGLPPDNGLAPELAAHQPDDGWRRAVAIEMRAAGVRAELGPDGDVWFRRLALQDIRARPGAFVGRVPKKLAAFWAPDFFLPRHLVRDWYGRTSPTVALGLLVLTWAAAAVPLLVGPAALGVLKPGALRSLTLTWLATSLLVHGVTYGHSRLHQPLVPLLVLAVAGVLTGSRAGVAGWRRWLVRGAPWAGLALTAWLLALPAVAGQYLLPGPRHARTARALGWVRHLPLAGSARVAWSLADVEASLGRADAAERVLSEPGIAEHPWSRYRRGLLAADPGRAAALLEAAVEADPALFPAWLALARVRLAAGDPAAAAGCVRRALGLRPRDAEARRLQDALTPAGAPDHGARPGPIPEH